MLRFQLQGGALDAGRGVVDKNVDAAELGGDLLEETGDAVGVSDVGLGGEASDTKRLDLGGGLAGGLVAAQIAECDVCPQPGEFQGNGAPYSAASARHHGHLAIECCFPHGVRG